MNERVKRREVTVKLLQLELCRPEKSEADRDKIQRSIARIQKAILGEKQQLLLPILPERR